MRVAVLGIGGLGRTLVRQLRSEPSVDGLVLLDRDEERAKWFAATPGRVRIHVDPFVFAETADLGRHIRGCDVLVNTLPPKHNLAVMRACLEAGVSYLDTSATGPRTPGGLPGILEQLALHDAFRDRGVKALVSMGLDPGMSNVLAKDAAQWFDTVDAIRIRSGGTARVPGTNMENFPLYSREGFLSDILIPPTVWSDGRLEERDPMSEPEDFPFPDPVGSQRAFLVSHEEVKTLPRYLGKKVGRVDFKHSIDPHLVEAILALDHLGLLAPKRTINVAGQPVPFRKAFLEALPEPSALGATVQGAKALSVEVEGTASGMRRVQRRDIVLDHHEAAKRASITSVPYLTAVAAAIGTLLLGAPDGLPPGVHPAEALDPGVVLRAWSAREVPLAQSQRVVAG